jgi:coproporphyrinogen III oxidase
MYQESGKEYSTYTKFYNNYMYKQYQPMTRGIKYYFFDIGHGSDDDKMDGVIENSIIEQLSFTY